MKIEDIYFVVNFYTEDMADRMMEEDDENFVKIPENEMVMNFLKEEGLSIDLLNGATGVMKNIDKTLLVEFGINNETYRATLLEFIGFKEFLGVVNTFLEYKKVKFIDVSTQVGGVIDTNYGIKFKIEYI